MEYPTELQGGYEVITPGIAGIAQKIPSKYKSGTNEEGKETSKLFALTRNEIISCGHNQY